MFEKMKKSTIEKINGYIPDDLTLSILSKLHLKSLVRFRCVRKSWCFLFENCYFMNMYRMNFASNNNFSYADDSCLALELTKPYYEHHGALFSLSGKRFKNKIKLDWPPPIQEDDQGFSLFGCVGDGTLCFYKGLIIPKIVLWNLTSKEFKVLPPSPLECPPPSYHQATCSIQGFGYDHVRDDHKVIRHVAHCLPVTNYEGYIPPHDSMWEVYCLKSNYWKKLDVDHMPASYHISGFGLHTNGVCHWWDEHEDYLASFDLSKDMFYRTPLPSFVDDNFDLLLVDKRFVSLNGSITLISSWETSYANTPTYFHISILGELGVKESWTKLFTVGPLHCVDHPVGAGNKGDLFFLSKNGELVRFDLNTQVIEKLGIKSVLGITRLLYKEVLLPMGGLRSERRIKK